MDHRSPYRAIGALMIVLALVGPVAASGSTTWDPDQWTGAESPCQGHLLLDVVIMIDASGSMGGEISALKSGFSTLVADLDANYDTAFGLVVFGWYPGGEGPITTSGGLDPDVVEPLSTNPAAVDAKIASLSANGGWEPWGDAIYIANHHTSWRPGSNRIGVIVTDEPVDEGRRVPGPLSRTSGADYDGPAFYSQLSLAATNGIRFAAIDAAGSGLTKTQLTAAATTTGGAYAPLTTASDLVSTVKGLVTSIVPPSSSPTLRAHAVSVTTKVETSGYTSIDTGLVESEALVEPGPGADVDATVDITLPAPINGYVRIARDEAYGYGGAGTVEAHARATIEEFSLLGGAVRGSLLRADARAWITPPAAGHTVTDSHWASLTVGTRTVAADGVAATLTLPGGLGYVNLNEVTTVNAGTNLQEARINLVHVVADTGTASIEVVIGHAYAGVACEGELSDPHDDPASDVCDAIATRYTDGCEIGDPPVVDPCEHLATCGCLTGDECIDPPCEDLRDCVEPPCRVGDDCIDEPCVGRMCVEPPTDPCRASWLVCVAVPPCLEDPYPETCHLTWDGWAARSPLLA